MALVFPSNPSVGFTYQSGSSSTYRWNGSYWAVLQPAISALTVVTASYSERVVWVQQTPPPTSTGSLWYDQDTGNMYVKYDNAWVPAQSTIGNATTASFAQTARSASFAVTASNLSSNFTPYYIQAGNSIGQSIPSQQVTTITGWSNTLVSTGSAWNATTGIFTCPRAGWYRLRGALTYTNNTASIGREFNTIISVNDGNTYTGWTFRGTTSSIITMTTPVEAIHQLAVGDTVRIKTYQDSLGPVSIHGRGDINLITIQELPNFITK